ncbi:Uncharacterised protein [Raoultella ornithinolytica]|nr:Uncharacterised protein [Raoultella ornithinolytica]
MEHADQGGKLFVNRRVRAVFRQDQKQRLTAGEQAHGLAE